MNHIDWSCAKQTYHRLHNLELTLGGTHALKVIGAQHLLSVEICHADRYVTTKTAGRREVMAARAVAHALDSWRVAGDRPLPDLQALVDRVMDPESHRAGEDG